MSWLGPICIFVPNKIVVTRRLLWYKCLFRKRLSSSFSSAAARKKRDRRIRFWDQAINKIINEKNIHEEEKAVSTGEFHWITELQWVWVVEQDTYIRRTTDSCWFWANVGSENKMIWWPYGICWVSKWVGPNNRPNIGKVSNNRENRWNLGKIDSTMAAEAACDDKMIIGFSDPGLISLNLFYGMDLWISWNNHVSMGLSKEIYISQNLNRFFTMLNIFSLVVSDVT